MRMESALERLVGIARQTFQIAEHMRSLGISNDPYFSFYGKIADAIYDLLGEETDTLKGSVAYYAIHNAALDKKEAADVLMREYKKKNISVPCNCDHVEKLILDTAKQRDISPCNLVRAILSEWALKQAYAQRDT